MENRCGHCGEEVTGIEPAVCGFCSTLYHVGRECSGVSRTDMNNFFSKGAAIWICPPCRQKFDGNSTRNLLKTQAVCIDLQSQIARLTQMVQDLASKVDDNCRTSSGVDSGTIRASVDGKTMENVIGSGNSLKARRYGNDGSKIPPPMKGTKTVDTCNLTVTNVIAEPRFWLYLTGFRPSVTKDDVGKFVKDSLEYDEDIEVVKLVTKDADLSKLSFVSFKIGLHPDLQDRALSPSTWPSGVGFREFEELSSKNR